MFPVRLELAEDRGLGESLKTIKEQLRRIPDRGITYGVLRYLSGDPEIARALEAAPQPEVSFNYLGQVNQAGGEHSPLGLEPAGESFGAAFSPLGERRHLIDVIGIVVGGRLRFDWAFSSALHETSTIDRLANSYVEVLREIVAHCQSPEAGGYTPSDFPLAGLDDDALNQILTQVEFDKE
jgi:non-ribosomal peptide synthase protein (TIGR01720 family)